MRGGSRVIIEPHRHEGVFIARGKEDALVTKNLVPGETVYGEKKISVEVCRLGGVACLHSLPPPTTHTRREKSLV